MIDLIQSTIDRINSDLSKAYFQATGINEGPIWITAGPDEYPNLNWNLECKWCNTNAKESIHFMRIKLFSHRMNMFMLQHSLKHLEYPKKLWKVYSKFSTEHYSFMQQAFLHKQTKEDYAVSIGLKDNNLTFVKCNICLDEFDIESDFQESIDKHVKKHVRMMTFP